MKKTLSILALSALAANAFAFDFYNTTPTMTTDAEISASVETALNTANITQSSQQNAKDYGSDLLRVSDSYDQKYCTEIDWSNNYFNVGKKQIHNDTVMQLLSERETNKALGTRIIDDSGNVVNWMIIPESNPIGYSIYLGPKTSMDDENFIYYAGNKKQSITAAWYDNKEDAAIQAHIENGHVISIVLGSEAYGKTLCYLFEKGRRGYTSNIDNDNQLHEQYYDAFYSYRDYALELIQYFPYQSNMHENILYTIDVLKANSVPKQVAPKTKVAPKAKIAPKAKK